MNTKNFIFAISLAASILLTGCAGQQDSSIASDISDNSLPTLEIPTEEVKDAVNEANNKAMKMHDRITAGNAMCRAFESHQAYQIENPVRQLYKPSGGDFFYLES